MKKRYNLLIEQSLLDKLKLVAKHQGYEQLAPLIRRLIIKYVNKKSPGS